MFRFSRIALPALLVLAGMSAVPAPSHAAERQRDRVYADSFGNLVIYSRAGYKRIIVGKGHLADQFAAYSDDSASDPNVVRLDDERGGCYRPPVLLKGRSYMYGLEDGEIPEPAGSCYR